jgi:vacuolar-type H+-ATPase subunit I/STV1
VARQDPTRRTTRVRGLLDRVIQQRRGAGRKAPAPERTEVDRDRRIRELTERVEQLEALVEGLQDSIHRELTRHEKEIGSLGDKTQPAEMTRALGKYSQERGL